MKLKRREMIAAGGLAAGALGFSQTLSRMAHGMLAKKDPKEDKLNGYSHEPEYRVNKETGEITLNPKQQVSYTTCLGCTTICGVRVRIDKETGRVLRVGGNPFHPLAAANHLPYETSVKDSFIATSQHKELGQRNRATLCGRGNAVKEYHSSPFRVLQPLKRVGPRNSGKWEPISFEQLIREVADGGDLFGEGHVKGFKELRDLKTPIKAEAPEFGPIANKVGVITSVNDGREALIRRFWNQSFGTQNFVRHGAWCGGSWRSGSGAVFGDHRAMPHAKPDMENAEFVIFIGTAPGATGNPFRRTGELIAKARTDGKMDYVIIDPVLSNADNRAAGDRSNWVPIIPGTDSALLMAMMRWIFENDRHNKDYLSCANPEYAESRGFPSYCSAAWLVIQEPSHPRYGKYLRGSDIGVEIEEEKRYGDDDPYIVLNEHNEFESAINLMSPAQLEAPEGLLLNGKDIKLKTALQLLKESAMRQTIEEASAYCGIPVPVIEGLADEFTSHGTNASIVAHGGMMSGNGFYNAFAVVTLNTLIGNLNTKGGFVMGGGGFRDASAGPRYNLVDFEGKVQPRGIPIGRNVPFERTSEFKRRKEAGEPLYPAPTQWYPNAPGLGTEWFASIANDYPYKLDALILWMCNPVYGMAGLKKKFEELLLDPKKIPLIVSIDPFINETNCYADYIVPDSLLYESWGWVSPWNGVPTKTMAARWPVVEAAAAKTPSGQPIAVESFHIELAKYMGLPGFGKEGLKDADGNPVPLETAEDWYFRGGANIAYAGGKPVPDATDEDLLFSGVERMRADLESRLKPEEWRKIAYIYTRGGRFENADQAQDKNNPEWQKHRFSNVLWIWNENVGSSRNYLNGEHNWGTAQFREPHFSDGTPMREIYSEEDWPLLLVSFKSQLLSSYTIGTSLTILKPDNPMIIHPDDAKRFGLTSGQVAKVSTPGGAVEGTIIVYPGVMRGCVGIEHGFGHTELGGRAHQIGDHTWPDAPFIRAGVNINDIGLTDPTRNHENIWVDSVSGAVVRNGLPAKVEPIAG